MIISSPAFDLKIRGISTKTKERGERVLQKLLEMIQFAVPKWWWNMKNEEGRALFYIICKISQNQGFLAVTAS